MTEQQASPKFELAQDRLKSDLKEWIADRRSKGRSWRSISVELRDATNVDVTDVTLRAWGGE